MASSQGEGKAQIQSKSLITQRRAWRKKRKSNEASVELIEFGANRDPHMLAYDGDLDSLKALIIGFSLSIKVKDSNGSTLLHAAASNDQVEVMQYLIDGGLSLNAKNSRGDTPLHVATQNASIGAVDFLMERKADDTILNQDMDAPLHIAVRSKNLKLVQVFLKHPHAELVVHGYRKRTALHIAAEHNLMEIVDAIHGAALALHGSCSNPKFRVCAGDADGVTPVHYAARCGSHKVLELIITRAVEHGYPLKSILGFLDEENSSPLNAAVDAGHLEVVKVLLKFGASPVEENGDQLPAVHLACFQGKLEMVKAMVEKHGPRILHFSTVDGSTPLHWAAHSIHGACLNKCLIELGAPLNAVNREGRTPLHNAIIFGSVDAVQTLLEAGADAFAKDNIHCNAFHLAVMHNRKAALRILLKESRMLSLLHEGNSKGETPVHTALRTSQRDILAILMPVVQGQISNQKDANGNNYLHLAATSGDWRALGHMLNTPSAQRMLNETNYYGSTPLHVAAMKGHVQCLEMLLGQGAMIHKNHSGYTPFMSACAYGHKDAANVLFLAHPFQRDWTDDEGNSALHIAVNSGSSSTVQLLLDLGIPITHNQEGITFMDMIINDGNDQCAKVVVQHNRWQECLDYPTMNHSKHPFVRLVETMPEVAQLVLNRSHSKSSLPQGHQQYWEEYDFKYLRLAKEDIDGTEGEDDETKTKYTPLLMEEKIMKQHLMKHMELPNRDSTNSLSNMRSQGMQALQVMLKFRRVPLLTHPVVIRYLKMKWRKYGRALFLSYFFLFVIQVLCLSVFITTTPIPRLNISASGQVISSVNETVLEISPGSNVLRFVTLFLCFLCSVVWVIDVFATGFAAFNITKYELIWVGGGAHIAIYAFLIPWKFHIYKLNYIYWEAGAVAGFLGWLAVVLFLKHFDVIGIYVTMFLQVFTTLVKVLIMCFFFLLAFGLTFYIIVGEQSFFSSFGNSLFVIFSYMLGEIDYITYIDLQKNGMLQYPVLTFLFVLTAAVLLAVVIMNLLIGLAVGDIDKIRQNALVRQRSDEVRIFTKVDNFLPLFFLRRFNVRYVKMYPNKKVNFIRAAWRFLWRSFKGDSEDDGNELNELRQIVEEQHHQIKELKEFISCMSSTHNQQHEELRQMMEAMINLTQLSKDDVELSNTKNSLVQEN